MAARHINTEYEMAQHHCAIPDLGGRWCYRFTETGRPFDHLGRSNLFHLHLNIEAFGVCVGRVNCESCVVGRK